MVIKSVKHAVKPINFVISSIFYAVVSIVPVLTWMIFAPGNLEKFKPRIQSEVNKISGSYIFDIGDISLSWNDELKSLNFRSDKIFILNKYKQNVAHFDRAEFGTNFIEFFKKEPFITNINVDNSVIYLRSKYDIKSRKDNNINSKLFKYYAGNFFSFVSGLNSTLINKINFNEVSFLKPEKDKTTEFKIDSIKFKKQGDNKIIGNVIFDENIQDRVIINANSDIKNNQNVANIEFKDIDTKAFADYFLSNNKQIQQLDVKFNSTIKLDSKIVETMSQIPFNVTDLNGKIAINSLFSQALQIDSLNVFGKFNLDDGSVAVSNFDVVTGGAKIVGDLELSNLFSKQSFAPNILANLNASNVALNDLDKYWPIKLAVKARKWVTENISEGLVTTAQANLDISSKFLLEVKKWKQNNKETKRPILDKKAINAVINVENATVNYSKKFEKISSANAVVAIKDNAIKVQSKEARLIKTNLQNSNITIANMFEKPLKLSVKTSFNGRASDVVSYLKNAFKDKPKNQVISSLINCEGEAKGDVVLSLPIKKGIKYDDINLQVDAILNSVKLPKFIGKADLNKVIANLIINNSDIKSSGVANFNENSLSFDYQGNLKEKTANYKINGDISVDDANEFEIAKIPFVIESANISLDITQDVNKKHIDGVIDAKNTEINFPLLSFEKNKNVPALIKFKANQDKNKNLEVESFSYESEESLISGKLSSSNGKITKLVLDKLKHKNNDLNLSYKKKNNNIEIDFEATSLDFNDLVFAKLPKNKEKKEQPNILINGIAKKILMKKDKYFTDTKIDIKCENSFCQRIAINTNLGSKAKDYFSINTTPKEDNIRFDLKSNNAGYLLESISGSKNLKDGDLNFAGNYKNSDNGVVADGAIKLEDFSIIDTPTLARLFTLASFRGFADLLSNKGITFKKFSSPISYKNSVIEVIEAKSAGSAIGITSKGTIDFKNKLIDLKGALIPAHEVNKILGDIPILGTIIVGKKNEGIIATNYKIQGELQKPKISVNPLSMLTPGFLRNIFDIF